MSRAVYWRLGLYPPHTHDLYLSALTENIDNKSVDSDPIRKQYADMMSKTNGTTAADRVRVYAETKDGAKRGWLKIAFRVQRTVDLMSFLYHDIAHSNDFSISQRRQFIQDVKDSLAFIEKGQWGVSHDAPSLWKQLTFATIEDLTKLYQPIQRDQKSLVQEAKHGVER